MIKQQLFTKRLKLRALTEVDASRMFEIWSRPVVTKYMNISAFEDVEQAAEIIGYINDLAVEGKAIRYAITELNSHIIIGSCGFNYVDSEKSRTEIGYELDYDYWGRGYGPEVISCLCQYAFEELNMNIVEAKVERENVNSIKALQKSGFQLEGHTEGAEEINVYVKVKNS